jgi:hypothetical protein
LRATLRRRPSSASLVAHDRRGCVARRGRLGDNLAAGQRRGCEQGAVDGSDEEGSLRGLPTGSARELGDRGRLGFAGEVHVEVLDHVGGLVVAPRLGVCHRVVGGAA